jgi:hypothetical protein
MNQIEIPWYNVPNWKTNISKILMPCTGAKHIVNIQFIQVSIIQFIENITGIVRSS